MQTRGKKNDEIADREFLIAVIMCNICLTVHTLYYPNLSRFMVGGNPVTSRNIRPSTHSEKKALGEGGEGWSKLKLRIENCGFGNCEFVIVQCRRRLLNY